jgi:hypothetical protein
MGREEHDWLPKAAFIISILDLLANIIGLFLK